MKATYSNRFKHDALRTSGTLNLHPERVIDPLFRGYDFFDARDVVQVKYEMLRRVCIDGLPVQTAAVTFGFSRVGWYQVNDRYHANGLAGLLPQPRGPKSHPKKQS